MNFADADESPRRGEPCQAVDELAASESVYRTAGTTTAPFDCDSGLVFGTPLQLDKGGLKPIAWEEGRAEARHSPDLEGQRLCPRIAEGTAATALRGKLSLCVRCAICDRCAIVKTLCQMRHLERNSLREKVPVQETASAADHEMPSLCKAYVPCVRTASWLAAPWEKACVRREIWESSVAESPLACAVLSDRHARSLRQMRHSRKEIGQGA